MYFLRLMLIESVMECFLNPMLTAQVCHDWADPAPLPDALMRLEHRCALMPTDVAMVTSCFPAHAIMRNRCTSLLCKLTTGKMYRSHRSSLIKAFTKWCVAACQSSVLMTGNCSLCLRTPNFKLYGILGISVWFFSSNYCNKVTFILSPMLETGHKTDENTRKEEVAGKTLPEQIRNFL